MAARPRIAMFAAELAQHPLLIAAIMKAVGDALPRVLAQVELEALRTPAPADAPLTAWERQALKNAPPAPIAPPAAGSAS